jgi:DNA-binding Lrp family transcriptional regulator
MRISDSGQAMSKLDRIDYRILDALQENGRLRITRLAGIAGVSVSPCWQRVKRLEEAGIIRGYSAEIALERIGDFQTFLAQVVLARHSREAYAAFERCVDEIPEAVECYETTGQFDYHLKFIVIGIARYNQILEEFLGAKAGIEKYFTHVVTRVAKQIKAPRIRDIALDS